jgi:Uma2 family endonuclease
MHPLISRSAARQAGNGRLLLCNGDRMKQPEFHRRYETYPADVKFELVGGIVYMAAALRRPHGEYHALLATIFGVYQAGTPAVRTSDNATVILGEESEPQPDLDLRILEEYGGQSRVNEEEYLEGAPELIAEVAYSSRAIDLNQKKEAYQKAGVKEYLVLNLEDHCVQWFQFPSGDEIQPNRQGVLRSVVFPGLWLHVQALLDQDGARLIQTVQKGLASRDHAAFVRQLAAQRRP